MALHADAITQQGAAGERAGGIDGEDGDAVPALAAEPGEAVHQRALAGAGRAGDAHHPRLARPGVDPPDQLALGLAATFEKGDRPPQRPRLPRQDARHQLVERVGAGPHHFPCSNCRAMTSRWISLVPSPMVQILASR